LILNCQYGEVLEAIEKNGNICMHSYKFNVYVWHVWWKPLFPHFIYFYIYFFVLPVDECMSTNELKIGKNFNFQFSLRLKWKLEKKSFYLPSLWNIFKYFHRPHQTISLHLFPYSMCGGWDLKIYKVETF
jgi:hypothetical protein